jgi:hypothetical protein
MYDYDVRALEIHSLYAWDFPWIMKALDFIWENDMNALVLHRNDFLDLIIYPAQYFGADAGKDYETEYDRYNHIFRKLYKYTPTRRSGPIHRRAFFKRILHEAAKRNIAVYVENKELYFPEIILELHPHLLHNGAVCANDPFWWEFIKVKYTEFFQEFPQVAGIITSPGTGESRVSINSNRCDCERCKTAVKKEWYENLLYTMYNIIKAADRRLIIRDFVFDPTAQAEIASVMERMPDDVILALKNTPHDYYPTFPDNPRIGNVGNHTQWIEFDAMGQYFGWGIGIADLTNDFRRRLAYAKERGATGAIFRTDWESLDAQSSFHTPNLINQYAGAALSKNLKTPDSGIYRKYLEDEKWFLPDAPEGQKQKAVHWFASISSKTWPVTAKTPYVDACVFSDSSLSPLGLEHAYWLAEEKNSLRDWDKSKWEILSPTEENVMRSIKEKDDALRDITRLIEEYGECPQAIQAEKYNEYKNRLVVNQMYVRFYRAVVMALVLTRYILETRESRNSPFYHKTENMLCDALRGLIEMRNDIQRFYDETEFQPHTAYILMDPDRLSALYRNLTAQLTRAGFNFKGAANEQF